MINILYEDNHILVVLKDVNIPVQADDSKDEDLLTKLKIYLKEKYNKPGNVYLGLVHRLDRMVGGVMVFAKTSKAASRLSKQFSTNQTQKIYHAIVCGKINEKGTYHDYLLKDPKTNISKVVSSNTPLAKEAILEYRLLEQNDFFSLVEITLKTGRSHQIRVQFSTHGFPLLGDVKYNNINKTKTNIKLLAYSLSFYHPITKENLTFTSSKDLTLKNNS